MGRRKGAASELSEAVLRALYCGEGLSVEKVAARLGWSPSAVRNRLVELGIARRTPWAHNAVECEADELRRLYVDEGLSLSAIAKRYGCSLTTIWRKLTARYGVRSNRDLWGLGIHRKKSLRRLFERIDAYLRHARRRRDMMRAWAVLAAGSSDDLSVIR